MPAISRWFYLPSLLFLLLALISGTWLRLQWGWPQWQLLGKDLPWFLFFRTEYLLHAHSHVALLGWVFLALAGLILEAGTHRNRLPVRTIRVLAALIILVTIILFVAFIRDGYAPLSIAMSTVHMLFGYVFAWIFFRHARSDGNKGSCYFLEGAVFWMVMASAGPLLLALSRGLSPFWMDVAVHYYLHVLFNGWLLFGLAGLSYRYYIHPRYYRRVWPFWLMLTGLLPAFLSRLEPEKASFIVVSYSAQSVSGIIGSIMFAAGGMGVVFYTIISQWSRKGLWRPEKILFWTGLTGSLLVFLLQAAMAWPPVALMWTQSDFLRVGYIHLHLLGVVTTLLLYGLMVRMVPWSGMKKTMPQFPLFRISYRIGVLLFIFGVLAMIILLLLIGVFQLFEYPFRYPAQKLLFFTGLLTIPGIALLIVVIILSILTRRTKESLN